MKPVFEYQSYRGYLLAYIRAQGKNGRGIRARMAEAMNCQKGFLTKVLGSAEASHLSLEQAERLSAYLKLNKEETQYFLLMILFARAGTETLKANFRDQMKVILNRRLAIKADMESRTLLSPEDHMKYYSHWYFAAIRVAVSIPTLQTRDALAAALTLPVETVSNALEFLVSRNLVERKGDRFLHSTKQQVLLSSDHSMVTRNHSNWRLQALKSLDSEKSHDLHYSYVVTLSHQDALQIRSFLVDAIKEVQAKAAPSKEETLYSFCLDYFEILELKKAV